MGGEAGLERAGAAAKASEVDATIDFWARVREHKIIQWGVAYLGAALALAHGEELIRHAFHWPDLVGRIVMIGLIAGLPIALTLAWYHGHRGLRRISAGELTIISVLLLIGAMLFTVTLRPSAVGVAEAVVTQSANLAVSPVTSVRARARRPEPVALPSPAARVLRLSIDLGVVEPLGNTLLSAHVALSRDGRRLAYAAQLEGQLPLVYVRDLDQFEARALPGTEGAYHPFFSPDGEWVGFYSDQTDAKLKKVSVRGGSPQTLADAGLAAGGSWASDDVIVFATQDPSGGRGLFRIRATGGTPELLLQSNAEVGYITPELLPGGEAVLFVARPGPGGAGNARDGNIAVLSLASGEHRTLIQGGYRPQFAPTGHILFVRAGDLWAVPFDVERLQIIGLEVPVVEGVEQTGFTGGAAYAFSQDGVLVYVAGGDVSEAGLRRSLVWVDRQGREEPVPAESLIYRHPRLSPDGRRLALTIGGGLDQDIWTYDLARNTSSRLTFEQGQDWRPLWTPDGQRAVYYSVRGNGLYWRAADGTGQAERLTETVSELQYAQSFSPDGTQLVFMHGGGADWDLHVLLLANEPSARPLLQGGFNEMWSQLSPDGTWLAYTSDETGREEIYVRPFPNVEEGKWQISTDGGSEPRWTPAGRELFYRRGSAMMRVEIETEPAFSAGVPSRLFEGSYADVLANRPSYDVSPDGQRFLMLKEETAAETPRGATQLLVVHNWFDELERLAPPAP